MKNPTSKIDPKKIPAPKFPWSSAATQLAYLAAPFAAAGRGNDAALASAWQLLEESEFFIMENVTRQETNLELACDLNAMKLRMDLKKDSSVREYLIAAEPGDWKITWKSALRGEAAFPLDLQNRMATLKNRRVAERNRRAAAARQKRPVK